MVNPFAHIPSIYLLYIFYGAAFMILSLSIFVKDMKGSSLRLAGSLWLLGLFGFTHGLREWIEMYPLLEGEDLSLVQIFEVKALSAAMLIISFLFLLQFGMSLTYGIKRNWPRWIRGIPVVLFIFWVLYIWINRFGTNMQLLRQVEIGARNTFGLIGGVITAYGLILYSDEVKNLSQFISRNLYYAGIAFSFYGVFASGYFSTIAYFYLPFPAELLRGVAAVLITCCIIRALNIFDLETRKRIEKQTRLLVQAEKLTSLGQLAAGIAHEINNPLTNASLGIQTLKRKWSGNGEKNEIREKLDAVERNIDRASVIAQELLQFSRQREVAFSPLNINDVLRSSLMLMKHKLKTVVVEQDLTPVPDILGDRGKLEQVFINVLSNSMEAMPAGGRISISTQQKNGVVEVRITDTGVGITQENLSRIFDPFFTTKEVGSGTGLGLSICYGIIKQHHGRIKLSSTVGQGTTVTVKIPRAL